MHLIKNFQADLIDTGKLVNFVLNVRPNYVKVEDDFI